MTTRNTTAAARTYTIYVHGWSTNGPSANVTLFDWILGGATGNASVTPLSTTTSTGTPVTYNATFSGLVANTRYLGAVDYDNTAGVIGRTFLAIRTP